MCAFLGPTSLGLSELLGLPEVYFSFARLGKFSFIIFSHNFSISSSSFSPSGTLMIQMLECFKLFQRFLSPSSFFEFLFLHSVLVECLFLPSAPNRSESQFPSLHPSLYFTFHSLHFFLYFAAILNHFCDFSYLFSLFLFLVFVFRFSCVG